MRPIFSKVAAVLAALGFAAPATMPAAQQIDKQQAVMPLASANEASLARSLVRQARQLYHEPIWTGRLRMSAHRTGSVRHWGKRR